ncbi:hypothetical protein HNP38_002349 [Chryseobacterium defluvii]|uniref:TonB-like protein n=1 Tax=Chryseobacterium defluvii TaxID=160396 RepID=A0A840KEP2_9FLAO|nr:hypothetical protein [Chryseobacterium defluvii]MBB4807045.1 hypothetical protein [Chryseobacterium defluvii]
MGKIFYILILASSLASCQSEKPVRKYPAQVGDIKFDEKIDDANFKRCIPEDQYRYQYYNDSNGFQYRGEKIAIIEKLAKSDIYSDKKTNGYITVRFLVNCEAKTGLFRVKQINNDYQETVLDNELKNKLLTFTKSLDGWIPKEIKGKKIDYYQYLTYKIVDGKVSEILP